MYIFFNHFDVPIFIVDLLHDRKHCTNIWKLMKIMLKEREKGGKAWVTSYIKDVGYQKLHAVLCF